MSGFLTPSGEYYESDISSSIDDIEIPLRPLREGEWLFIRSRNEWVSDRRSESGRRSTPTLPLTPLPEPPPIKICHRGGNCLIGETASTCPPELNTTCKEEVLKEKLAMLRGLNQSMQGSSFPKNDGFTWTIKELLPFLVTLGIALASAMGTYVKLTTDITLANNEIYHLKHEQTGISKKIDELVKSNEAIRSQLTEMSSFIFRGKNVK
jgi:hypothetical protein